MRSESVEKRKMRYKKERCGKEMKDGEEKGNYRTAVSGGEGGGGGGGEKI